MWNLLLENRKFRTYMLARFVNNIGTMFTYMLLIVLSYGSSHNMGATMGVLLAETFGTLLCGSFAGVFVDRRSPIRVMVSVYLIQAVLIGSLFWLPQVFWVYYLSAFLTAVISSFSRSASWKYRSLVVDEESRAASNASITIADEVQKIIGPALAVFVLSLFPSHLHRAGFLIDGISYLLAAWMFAGLLSANFRTARPIPPVTKSSQSTSPVPDKQSFWRSWKEGFQPLKDPAVAATMVMFLVVILAISGTDVTYTAYITQTGHSSLDLGYVISALSAGLILSASVAPKFTKSWPLSLKLAGSTVGMGVFFFGTGLTKWIALMILTNFVLGLFNAINNVYSITFWQDVVPVEMHGRFFGLFDSLTSVVAILALVLNGALGTIFGSRFVILLAGGIMMAAGLIGLPAITIGESRRRRGAVNPELVATETSPH
jgi:MFS transporter, DHA3 family, macrolide efflux protein